MKCQTKSNCANHTPVRAYRLNPMLLRTNTFQSIHQSVHLLLQLFVIPCQMICFSVDVVVVFIFPNWASGLCEWVLGGCQWMCKDSGENAAVYFHSCQKGLTSFNCTCCSCQSMKRNDKCNSLIDLCVSSWHM